MQAWGPPHNRPPQGLVASRIEAYTGLHRTSAHSAPGGGSMPDLSHQKPHYLPFAKVLAQARGLSHGVLWEPEPGKRHRDQGPGPPHSPKFKEVTKAHQLNLRLHTFSLFGMPRLPPEDRKHWEIGEGGDHGLTIEKSWRELVPGHQEMSRELCHQQEALWELLTTEALYVRKLKIMTDLLAAGLLNLQRVGLLVEVSAETLFGNVPSLIRAHRRFWEEVLEPSLEETRSSGQPLDPLSLQNGFLMFSQRFHPYIQYCLNVKHTMAYARAQQDSNPLFHTFVKWCENHKRSGRQMLGDLLIKPQQRITKYPLLLQAVLKRSPEPRVREALNAMMEAVESFLHHINGQVRRGEEQESLAAAIHRIGPYEVLEPSSEELERNLRPFSTLDLMSPMSGVAPEYLRQLLLEGPVRVKEGREGKLDVHLFLFSDLLLVTKPQRRTDKAKVIRPPLMLEKLVCRPLRDPNSFLLIHLSDLQCVASALVVHCSSPADRARWLGKTQQAQDTLQKLKSKEFVRQKRELLALYRDQGRVSPSTTRPSSPSPEDSEGGAEGRAPEATAPDVPQLVVTEDKDTDEEEGAPVPDDASDSGYSTLSSRLSRAWLLRPLRRDPRLTFSTLELRDLPLRPQPPGPQAPQRHSAPELPPDVQRGGSLPRGQPPTWWEEGDPEAQPSLHPPSPAPTDSVGDSSPWDSEEEEGGPRRTPSPRPLRAEEMLREIREDLAGQRIEGAPAEPGVGRPRRLTRAQLQRMRGPRVIQLDTPLSVSEV
ncbi:pleckstrin homology domain-containing family G member 6 [Thomomys bottae]